MQVIGVTGRSGCGKNALAQYLKQNYGLEAFSIGALVRDIAKEREIPPTRRNLHQISTEIMRDKGSEFFGRAVVEAIERSGCESAVVADIRTPADVRVLRDRFDRFLLVRVKIGDQRARFARISERGAERDPDSFADFLEQDMAEESLFHIGETVELADVTIRNMGTSSELEDEIDLRIAARVGLVPASRQGA